jgi:hypothetical protein
MQNIPLSRLKELFNYEEIEAWVALESFCVKRLSGVQLLEDLIKNTRKIKNHKDFCERNKISLLEIISHD